MVTLDRYKTGTTGQMAMTLQPKIERRKVERRDAKIDTTLVHDDGIKREAGVIRNISSAGAKLSLASTEHIPDSAYILIPIRHQIEACRVVWRSAYEVGLAFALAETSEVPTSDEAILEEWADAEDVGPHK